MFGRPADAGRRCFYCPGRGGRRSLLCGARRPLRNRPAGVSPAFLRFALCRPGDPPPRRAGPPLLAPAASGRQEQPFAVRSRRSRTGGANSPPPYPGAGRAILGATHKRCNTSTKQPARHRDRGFIRRSPIRSLARSRRVPSRGLSPGRADRSHRCRQNRVEVEAGTRRYLASNAPLLKHIAALRGRPSTATALRSPSMDGWSPGHARPTIWAARCRAGMAATGSRPARSSCSMPGSRIPSTAAISGCCR